MRLRFLIASGMVAMQVSQTFAVERNVTERARLAFHEQMSFACRPTDRSDWIASGAVYRYNLDDTGARVLSLEGRAAALAHLCALRRVEPEASYTNVRVLETLEKETVFIQYEVLPFDVTARRATKLAIIQMNGDQIASFTLLNRSTESLVVLQRAFGAGN